MRGPFSDRTSRLFIFSQLFVWPALAACIAGMLGVRLNLTASVPIGLYLTSSSPKARFAEFCPPEPFGSMSVNRGYRRRSAGCPDHGEPLLKPIIARAGDLVEVTSDGIRVNGSPIPSTRALPEDSACRPLSPWPIGLYHVGPGSVWVASSYNPRSFDSRYFGPIRLTDIKSRLRPLWVD